MCYIPLVPLRSTPTFALSSLYMSFTQYESHTTTGYQTDNLEVGFGMGEVRLMKENLISSFFIFGLIYRRYSLVRYVRL